jgi:2-dehydropantoate 2-reductase
MRILIVGAGAIGGYFGGRLIEAGRDVTFLVRPRRGEQLASNGLVIKSSKGNLTLANPPTVLAQNLNNAYDLILLSCKAYDLDDAIASLAPAVGSKTAILPLLNGMRHLENLDNQFGRDRVLGGLCIIATTLDEHGTIVHLNNDHQLSYGERDGARSDRMHAIARAMANARFESHPSDEILQEMWEKWVFLTTVAGSTCLMRAAIGDIALAPGGKEFVLSLIEECRAIADANGYPSRAIFIERIRGMLTEESSLLTASMLRDIERNGPIEADHVVGDLIRRGTEAGAKVSKFPSLCLVYTNLKAYDARRKRTLLEEPLR